jgi:hypothetical protein
MAQESNLWWMETETYVSVAPQLRDPESQTTQVYTGQGQHNSLNKAMQDIILLWERGMKHSLS